MSTARQTKSKAITARVNESFYNALNDYLDVTQMDITTIIRLGVQQYMYNHPAKRPSNETNKLGGING